MIIAIFLGNKFLAFCVIYAQMFLIDKFEKCLCRDVTDKIKCESVNLANVN